MANVLAENLRETVFKYVLEGHLTGDYEEDDLTPIDEELFKDFLIPKNWGLSTVKESCYIHARIGWQALSKREHLKNGDYMLITGTDFQNGLINYSTCVYVSKERYDMDEKIKIQNDDILITKDGTLGKVAVVKNLPKPATLNGGVFVVRPDERFNKEYVEIIFNSSYFARFINDIKKSTTIKHLNQSKLHSFLIPVPPIEEQQRIVDRVNELMAKIDEYEKLENQLVQLKEQFPKDMRDSLLQAAMSGKLTCYEDGDTNIDTYIEDLVKNKEKNVKSKKWKKEFSVEHIDNSSFEYSLGNNWKWCYLGDICAIRGGKRVPVGRKLSEEPTSQKYIRVADMKNHSVISNTIKYLPDDLIEKLALYTISKNDLYITVAGTIGDVGVVPNELDGANLTENADKIIFENIDKQWLMTCLLSNVVQRQINEATTQVGQPKLAIKRIQSLSIPLCPLEEQKRIVEKLDKMLPLVDALAQMD